MSGQIDATDLQADRPDCQPYELAGDIAPAYRSSGNPCSISRSRFEYPRMFRPGGEPEDGGA